MKAAAFAVPHPVRLTPTVPRRRWWLSWRLWVIALDALLLAAYFAVQKWPLVKIRQVTIEGPAIWESRALSQVALPSDSNLFSLDLDRLQDRLQAEFGSLAACRAQLLLPGKLLIQVVPTALTLWTEGGMGVGVDGSLLTTPAIEQPAPIWRAPLGSYGEARTRSTESAVSAWTQVLEADGRFTNAVSEWGCDSASGWTMVGADGKTRMNIGWGDLENRAYYVSQLLARPDTILAKPCAIDARFDGQLIVSRLAMPEDTTAAGDSGKPVVAQTNAAPQVKLAQAPAKSTAGKPARLAMGDSQGKTPPAKLSPSRTTRPAKATVTRPSKSTKSTKSTSNSHNSNTQKKIKPKNPRRGGA